MPFQYDEEEKKNFLQEYLDAKNSSQPLAPTVSKWTDTGIPEVERYHQNKFDEEQRAAAEEQARMAAYKAKNLGGTKFDESQRQGLVDRGLIADKPRTAVSEPPLAPMSSSGPMSSGYGPDQDLTVAPPPPRSLAEAPQEQVQSHRVKDYLLGKFYKDQAALDEADEAASRKNLLAALGSGMDQITFGVTGQMPDQGLNTQLRKEGENVLGAEKSRQERIREYLKDRAEMALKGKHYDAQLAEMKANKEYRDRSLGIQEQELGIKKQEALNKGLGGSLEYRTKALGAQEKKDLANQKESMEALQAMHDALSAGDNTFSLVGDNNFTFAKKKYTEALGRLQSGGAIGAKELETFESFVPNARDSAEMQRKKLQTGYRQMADRLGISGFKPEEFGLNSSLVSQQDLASKKRQQEIEMLRKQMEDLQRSRK